ncbi:MAG: DUF1461 domain-containing protein [Planctomycetota bacterium]
MGWSWVYQRRAWGRWLWEWLPALCWLPVIAAIAVEVGIRSDLVWDLASGPLGIHAAEPAASALHDDLHRFYYAGQAELMHPRWSADERAHLHDVRNILDRIRLLGIAAGALILVLSLWRWERFWWMRRGGILMAGLLIALGILSTQWSVFSRVVHPVVFPHGNWDFMPGRDVIIALYTQEMLAIYAAAILLMVVLGTLLLWFLGRLGTEPVVRPVWRGDRRQWYLAVGLILAAGPCWWAGTRMYASWDPGYLLYLALALLLVPTAIWALAARDKSWPVLLLLILVACWNIQILALRGTVAAAARTCATGGEELRLAIEDWRTDHGGVPPQALEDLIPRYLPALPPIDGGAGPWFYRRHGRHFAVGFPGPLDFGHGYTSWRGSWNTLPWLGVY